MRRAFVALCALAWAGALAAAPAPLTVRLANEEWPPYLGASLPHQGLLSRVVTAAFARENVRVEYVFVPNHRAIDAARRGVYDGSLGWAPTPERQRDLAFSAPVMMARMVFFERRDAPHPWRRLSDLAGLRVGSTLGNSYSAAFAVEARDGRLLLDEAPDDVANLKKLAAGRVDLFPIDLEVGRYLSGHFLPRGEAQRLVPQPQPFWSAPLHVVIWRGHARRDELLARFNRGLAKLKASGEFARLVDDTRDAIAADGHPTSD